VAVNGQRVPLVGRVSMDMLTVDLTGLPSAGVGSTVELWGDQVAVSEVAAGAGTIAYELLCNAKRVPRFHVEGEDDLCKPQHLPACHH
jgi:alanine racemase